MRRSAQALARTSAREPLGEVVDGDAPLGLVGAPGVDARRCRPPRRRRRPRGCTGSFSSLALRMRAPSGSSASTRSARKPVALEPVDDALGVGVVVAAHREHAHLHRAPATRGRRRRSARASTAKKRSTEPNSARWIMIGRWRSLSAPTYSMLEALRQLEVELDGGHLPRAADGVARLHGDLRAVERAAARVHARARGPWSTRPGAAPRWPPPTPRRCRRTSPRGLVDSSR